MGRIKSALELALEKTESVKSDKSAAGNYEARQQGKRLANAFIAGENVSLESEIRRADRETRAVLRQGMFEALIAQTALPVTETDQKRLEAAGKGLEQVCGGKRAGVVYKQFMQYMVRYTGEVKRFDENIRAQYEPRLRQKEEELSRRLGTQVNLDPFQDAEFVNAYNKNLNSLRESYQTVVDQVREQIRQIFEQEIQG
jgi:hypothetical protein